MKSESRKKYLLKNTIIFALGNFGTKIISFFLVPLYTNILTTSEYGNVDLISTISMVLGPVLILNIGEALLRFPLDENSDNNAIMSGGMLLLLFGIILGIIIIPISKCFSDISSYAIYLYFYVISYACFQVFSCYLRGTEKLVAYSIGNILNTLLIALFNICFLCFLRLGIKGYLMAYILAFICSSIYAFFAGKVYNVFFNFKIDKKLMMNMLKYSVVLIPTTFLWWITNSSDRIMVTSILGSSANGVYAISYKIPTILSTIALIFNQAWSYSAIKEEKSNDKEEFNNRMFYALAAFLTILAMGMMMIMKPFLKIYVDKAYYDAWKYTPYLIVGFVFSSLGSFLATPYTVHKDSKGYLFSALIGAGINIILNFILIPLIGIDGAALATLISYIAVLFYRLCDTRKYLKIHFLNVKNLIGYFLLFIVAATMYLEYYKELIIAVFCILISLFMYRDIFKNIIKNILKMLAHKQKNV